MNLGFQSVRVSHEYKAIYDFLRVGKPPRIEPVFTKHTNAFVLMAVVGLRYGEPTTLRNPEELFKTHYLEDDEVVVLKSLALRAKAFRAAPTDILRNSKEIVNIAEQYANTGMRFFCDKLFGGPEALLKLITVQSAELEEASADVLNWVLSESQL